MDQTITNWWEFQLRNVVSPAGLIGAVVLIALFFWAVGSKRGRWAVLALLLYSSSFALDGANALQHPLITPLHQIREQAQPLMIALMLVFIVATTITGSARWRKPYLAGVALLFTFQLIYDARLSNYMGWTRGGLGIVAHTIEFVCFVVCLGWELRSIEDVESVVRCFAIAGLLFGLTSFVQIVVDPAPAFVNYRFQGTTHNPNVAAMFIALTLPATCYLAMQPAASRWKKFFWGASGACQVVLLAWTGTRGGTLAALVGLGLLFRLRIGKFATTAVLIGALAFLIIALFSGGPAEAVSYDRFFSLEDTRTAVWSESWQSFLNHPVFGEGYAGTSWHESSYLSLLAMMGVSGLIPFGLAALLISNGVVNLQRLKKQFGQYEMLADLVTAWLIAMAVSAVFEALLFGTFATPIMSIFIALSLVRALADPLTEWPEAFADYLQPAQQLEYEQVPSL